MRGKIVGGNASSSFSFDEVNSVLNAIVSVASPFIQRKSEGKLSGMTFAIKDNIHVSGLPTRCASRAIHQNYIPTWNATCVEALLNEGAVIAGKSNMDEFGMGSHCINSIYGPTINPKYDLITDRRSAGGSSGGSSAAVSSSLVHSALGSDTGGSIRLPAAYCGIYGLKPTYGRISRHGLVSYASSLDTVGLMSRTAADLRRIFEVLRETAGLGDDTAVKSNDLSLATNQMNELSAGLKVAIPIELDSLIGSLPYNSNSINKFINQLKRLPFPSPLQIDYFSIPSLRTPTSLLNTYYTLASVEAFSCLSRYPWTTEHPKNKKHSTSTLMSFGPVVQERVALGRWIASNESIHHLFENALRMRQAISNEFNCILQKYHFILMPTAFTPPPLLSQLTPTQDRPFNPFLWERRLLHNENSIDLDDLFTVPASLASLPALVYPTAHDNGVQLIGAQRKDELLLDLAILLDESGKL